MIEETFHGILKLSTKKNYLKFMRQMDQLKNVQLSKINMNYQNFSNLPLTNYHDYQKQFELQRSSGVHCVPTSGSTHKVKWIPYTKTFKNELKNASDPWIYDLYKRVPQIQSGKHYWSLSWVPEEFRSTLNSNDASLFSFFDQFILDKTMLVNEKISRVESVEQTMLLTLKKMFEEKLTLISVWSPTFLLELLDFSLTHKEKLLSIMSDSKIKAKLRLVNEWNAETSIFMFPNLFLISCWQTSSSFYFFKKLKEIFPNVIFQGKGLWSTEGVVSIPVDDRFLLAYQSHFYEFYCPYTERIYPAFELEKEMELIPILTTANGMTRYKTDDLVKIKNFYHTIPEIEFIGRKNVSDLVGEKIDFVSAQKLLVLIQEKFQVNALCFLAKKNPHPFYELIVECTDVEIIKSIADFAEKYFLGCVSS